MSVRAAALVALFVCLAGCSAAGPLVDDDATDPGTETPGAETTDEGTVGEEAGIWAGETIVVGIDGGANESRDWTPLVRSATDFWAKTDEQYLGYAVDFEVRPNATDPDVRVRFVERVEDCEGPADPVGCAPYYTDPDQIERPTTITVEAGLSDESTELVIEHEFGHVLGLDHGDRPADVMNHSTKITTLPRTNATERTLPWNDSTLSVYVDDVDDSPALREEVREALAYYDRGANGTVPERASFALVEDRSSADAVITFADDLACHDGDGSCGERSGVDMDGDGSLERYDRLDVVLSGVSTEATSWHVAYWLGYGFGFTEAEDWPAPLAEADDPAERRGEWWTG
jgi:hypothetical protein